MAQDFEKLFMNFAILGIFSLAVFAFIITLQINNESETNLGDDPKLNASYNQISNNINEYSSQANTQYTLFGSEKPTTTFGTFLFFSIISAGKIFGSLILGTFNTLIVLPVVFLGFPLPIISLIGAILIISIIFALWAKYKLG